MRVLRENTGGGFVWRNLHLNKSRMLLFLTLLALSIMLFALNMFPYASVGAILIPISYGLGVYTYRKKMLWSAGLAGEKQVVDALCELDDTHARISGGKIPPNRGDCDHIILAPNGLIVLEVKNIGGIVECRGDQWSRHKIGRAGGRYELGIGSPSLQAKRNAKTLKDLLLENQGEIFGGRAPHIWVHAAVVLPDETQVDCENPTVDVIKTSGVGEYIKGVSSGRRYSQRELEAIGCFLAEALR